MGRARPDGLFLHNVATKPSLQAVVHMETTGVTPMPIHHVNTAKERPSAPTEEGGRRREGGFFQHPKLLSGLLALGRQVTGVSAGS